MSWCSGDLLAASIKRLEAVQDFHSTVEIDQFGNIQKRVNDALCCCREYGLAKKIRDCDVGKLCSSVYCQSCRDRAATSLYKRFRFHFDGELDGDVAIAQRRLRYLTVLCELTTVDIDAIKVAVVQARKGLNAYKRRYSSIWVMGAFEFELVDLKFAERIKKKTLNELNETEASLQVLVHFHVLVDIKNYEESEMKIWLEKKWPGSRRVAIQETIESQPIDEKLTKIASYGFKNRVRFNNSFKTDGYADGNLFTNRQLSDLVSIYDGVGNKGYSSLLIGIGN